MRFQHPLQKGTIIERLNRFVVSARVDGRKILAHLSSSGRMTGLIAEGRRAWFIPVSGRDRKTSHRIVLAETAEGILVSVNAVLPNRLFREAFTAGQLGICKDYDTLSPEVTEGSSRFDFLLTGKKGRCFVEVKSVTLVREGTALFPDAPTLRGRKHVRELSELVRNSDTACAVVFVIQRGDAVRFQPHADMDPAFAEAVREAMSAGVRIYVYQCEVTLKKVRIQETIPLAE